MAAVRELLDEGTFHESTVEEVGSRAGVSRGGSTQDYDAAIHPEDLPRKQAAWRAALDPKGDGSYQAEYRLRRPG